MTDFSSAMAVTAMTILKAVLISQSVPLIRGDNPLVLFRSVKVSYSTVMTSLTLRTLPISPGTTPVFVCSHECNGLSWCDLWCHDDPGKQCIFSDSIVMPGYSENKMADEISCYTRRHKDLATGAAIEATPAEPRTATRVKENMVDGFFNRWDLDQCYHSEMIEIKHWLLMDFGVQATFRLVKIMLQGGGDFNMITAANSLEVRTGAEAVNTPGDFSSYELLGRFPGPASAFAEVIVIEAPTPVRARFVSIQKLKQQEAIQICHVEVY